MRALTFDGLVKLEKLLLRTSYDY